MVSCAIDPYLLEDNKQIAPGLGDFEKRFYGS
jgi:uracil phosphoribosyltransferase